MSNISSKDEGKTPTPLPSSILLTVPIYPVYLGEHDSYLRADGTCRGYHVVEFTYSSALTPMQTVFAKCSGNLVSTNLSVLKGDSHQVFTVKVVGYLSAPTTTTDFPPNVTVTFDPPSKNIIGFGVTSGGGALSGAFSSVWNGTVGEVTVGTQVSSQVMSRNGLQGVIDP